VKGKLFPRSLEVFGSSAGCLFDAVCSLFSSHGCVKRHPQNIRIWSYNGKGKAAIAFIISRQWFSDEY
jgi:hypothetical protein